jgi:8-oxo-dGTP pyrophosphatase MutT (NUDIX family)
MSFLDHVRACNAWDPAEFVPWVLEGECLGMLTHGFADHLRRWPGQLQIGTGSVIWTPPAADFEGRTQALTEIIRTLVGEGVIDHLHGELYPVTPGNRTQARLLIDRACAPYFGVRAFGQHLNGFVRDTDGLKLWIGRRAPDRRVYPGYLDNLVAGGLPWGMGLAENLRKECQEEAGMDAALADRALPVGLVTYCRASRHGLKPDVIYCYDLELPAGYVPRNTDGEVAAFYLWPVEQVLATVRDSDAFKLNCNLVIIDFLARHGYLDQEAPDYVDLLQGLRSPLP